MIKLSKIVPLAIILSGVILSLCLLSLIPDEIHFSGDAGLKTLLTKQFSAGNLNFDLDLSVPPWTHNLWDKGMYPFAQPFIYKISSRYYITFPFTFPLVTAPFYALFGFRGLYIIPLLSTWIIWFNFYRICQFFQLSILAISAGLATLIFASPLTMYSSIYWEHTLAVSLAFGGFAIILTQEETAFTKKNAVVSGVLIGLSVWFRPEFLAIVAVLLVLVIVSYLDKFSYFNIVSKNKTIFLISLILPVSCFFLTNKLIYGYPLGVHALQVVEEFSLRQRLRVAKQIFGNLWNNFQEHFPLIYLTIVLTVLSVFHQGFKIASPIRKILLIAIPFIFIVPILLPSDGGRQWSPRFLLILIPLFSLLLVFLLNWTLSIKKFGIRYISSTFFLALLITSFNINTIMGINFCYINGVKETLDVLNFLRKDSNKIVAVAHQYVSQTFEVAFRDKIFFLTNKLDSFNQLSLALHEQGYPKFVYICPSYDPCFSSPTIPSKLDISTQDQLLHVQLRDIQKNDIYMIQEAEIISSTGIKPHRG